eukprot:scaffold285_cov330-Pavlova_lutheri.AAC.148
MDLGGGFGSGWERDRDRPPLGVADRREGKGRLLSSTRPAIPSFSWWPLPIRIRSCTRSFGRVPLPTWRGNARKRDERHQRDASVRAGEPGAVHPPLPVRDLVRVPVRTPRR